MVSGVMSCSRLAGSRLLCRGYTHTHTHTLGYELELRFPFNLVFSSGLTDLKDLSKVRVPVGEHGVDAVDGVLGLSWGSPLGFSLQYRQQDTEGSQRDKDSYKVQRAWRKCYRVNDDSGINAQDWI